MKNKIVPLLMLVFLLNGWFSSVLASNITDVFQEGVLLYQKADSIYLQNIDSSKMVYEQAVNRFEYLVQKNGIKNGWLYYNLGNTYFRIGEIGNAIYNYRQAEKFLPGNRDLVNNLKYSKTFVQGKSEKNTKSVGRVFLDQVKSFPIWLKIMVFVLFYGSFWVMVSPPLSQRVRPLYKGLSLVLFIPVALILLLSVVYNPRKGIILNDGVIAKKGNSLVYEDAFYSGLNQGTEFRLKERRGAWIKIELIDGKMGWIEIENAGIIE